MAKREVRYDLRRGNRYYRSVRAEQLKKWILEGVIKEGEIEVWRSGLSGWRKPEELEEFKSLFKKRKGEPS